MVKIVLYENSCTTLSIKALNEPLMHGMHIMKWTGYEMEKKFTLNVIIDFTKNNVKLVFGMMTILSIITTLSCYSLLSIVTDWRLGTGISADKVVIALNSDPGSLIELFIRFSLLFLLVLGILSGLLFFPSFFIYAAALIDDSLNKYVEENYVDRTVLHQVIYDAPTTELLASNSNGNHQKN